MERRRFYERCGSMLQSIKEKRTGLKTACYKTETPAKYMAVLTNVLKRYEVLEKVLDASSFECKCRFVAMVICYEIIYGNKREGLKFSKKVVREVKDVYSRLDVREPAAVEDAQEFVYLRVNTLKATKADISSLATAPTIVPHVHRLLERVNYAKLGAYRQGHIFVQDLSSCLPAYVLNPRQGATVIDACAAPGNKTTHLAMLMNNTGTIYAVERDAERFRTLREMVEKSGACNVVTIHGDFLSLDKKHEALGRARYILVDPSCSGSGIHAGEEKDHARLSRLSAFQHKILSEALRYPSAERVVYSTCSAHEEENEEVVLRALKANPEFALEAALPEWPMRGAAGYDFSDRVIRCGPQTGTHGFFLACFVRAPAREH